MTLSTVISDAQAIDTTRREVLAEAGAFLAQFGTSETVGIVIYPDSVSGLLNAIDSVNFEYDTALNAVDSPLATPAKWDAANRKNRAAIKRIRRELDKLT